MAIIGSAQVINIMVSILRMKMLAIYLGPAGIGLLSIYNSLLDMMSTAAGLGMESSAVRQIASVRGEEQTLSRLRRTLLSALLLQGVLAMVGVLLMRAPIAEWLFGSREFATDVGLIGIAILVLLLGKSQTALLQGMRQIGDLGRVTVLSALFGTVAGLAAVWLYGEAGLIWFVVIQPMATAVIALHYTLRLPKLVASPPNAAEMWNVWKAMAKLGAAFMLAAMASAVTLLYVRSSIANELGLETAGHFAAAWGLTATYIGLLLMAMGADFYPRLAGVIRDQQITNSLVNDQAQLGLAIGGPLILLMIGMAPWIMGLLYSSEFSGAVGMLQLQMLGNVIKLAAFPIGYMIVAAARSKLFLFTELSWNVFFLFILWLWLPKYGLSAAGAAFSAAYLLNFIMLNILVFSFHGFRWERLSSLLFALHSTLALVLIAAAQVAPYAAASASLFLAVATGVFGLRVVLIKTGPEGRFTAPVARAYAAVGWAIPTIK